MALEVYNRFTGRKEEFRPLRGNKVGIYFCGMTVQDKPHMGHMLAFVAGDVIRRYLTHVGYDVAYVQNFTDIDDKIIARAREEGVDCAVVAERNIAEYFRYAGQLNILPADVYPKATEHIAEIIDLIRRLEEAGYAYPGGSDVYYRVRRFPGYGRLSGRRVDDLRSGARIEVGEGKEDPLDFTLWKGAREGEPAWDSPWGPGRPGWHIECSAMSMKYLGETLDMHGGGMDLVFPHHENEIAQSEAATGSEFVRYWMHNGLLNLGGEKMSKSTGNFFLIEDILKEFSGEVVRFYFLSTHFRSNSEFGRERMREAAAGFERIREFCLRLDEAAANGAGDAGDGAGADGANGANGVDVAGGADTGGAGGGAGGGARAANHGAEPGGAQPEALIAAAAERARTGFFAAMDDDFNSGEAVGHLFRLIREVNALTGADSAALSAAPGAVARLREDFALYDSILGLFREGLPRSREGQVPPEVLRMVEQREKARREKNWAAADELRSRVLEAGYEIEDRPGGAKVRRARK